MKQTKNNLSIIAFFLLLLTFSLTVNINNISAKTPNKWKNAKTFSKIINGSTFKGKMNESDKTCWITDISIGSNKDKTFKVPGKIDGMKVVELGGMETEDFSANMFGIIAEIAHGCSASDETTNHITKIILPDSIYKIYYTSFSGLNIKSINLPKNLKELEGCTFYGCNKLTKVNISTKLKKIAGDCFNRCPKLKTINISKNNKYLKIKNKCIIDKKGNLIVIFNKSKKIVVPKGVKYLTPCVFERLKCTSVTLPSTLKNIYCSGLNSYTIKKVKLSKNNKYLKRDKQTIYRTKDKSLAVIICPKGGTYKMSNHVKKMVDDYSVIAGSDDGVDWEPGRFDDAVLSKNLKTSTLHGFGWDACCHKVTFTAKKPPVLSGSEDGFTPIPIFREIAVPKESIKLYKKWYKRYDALNYVDKWYKI
ncbi:leucine-rich repeat domain-containing protein [Eubacterium xylanophilum]|uniref:leucine-rich repeat domain-containing protein n=1 Tax=Eubacterium xylanophilum TaxID=39497 RepID=UPI00047CFC84|nr:leucine-rich repeat domain-containing protein [Eubacterium xylanophilum]